MSNTNYTSYTAAILDVYIEENIKLRELLARAAKAMGADWDNAKLIEEMEEAAK